MDKVYIRKCERYTIWEASEPFEVDVEKLRKCEPPFEGETEQELLDYLTKNVYNEYEWAENETNKEVYGEDASYELTMEDCSDMEAYSDTREKYGQEWIDVGVPNDEWRKMGKFEVKATSVDDA